MPYKRKLIPRARQSDLTKYWSAYYVNLGFCSLCGNRGFIDTRGAKTADDLAVGRFNYCICPNGQTYRKVKAELPK